MITAARLTYYFQMAEAEETQAEKAAETPQPLVHIKPGDLKSAAADSTVHNMERNVSC